MPALISKLDRYSSTLHRSTRSSGCSLLLQADSAPKKDSPPDPVPKAGGAGEGMDVGAYAHLYGREFVHTDVRLALEYYMAAARIQVLCVVCRSAYVSLCLWHVSLLMHMLRLPMLTLPLLKPFPRACSLLEGKKCRHDSI